MSFHLCQVAYCVVQVASGTVSGSDARATTSRGPPCVQKSASGPPASIAAAIRGASRITDSAANLSRRLAEAGASPSGPAWAGWSGIPWCRCPCRRRPCGPPGPGAIRVSPAPTAPLFVPRRAPGSRPPLLIKLIAGFGLCLDQQLSGTGLDCVGIGGNRSAEVSVAGPSVRGSLLSRGSGAGSAGSLSVAAVCRSRSSVCVTHATLGTHVCACVICVPCVSDKRKEKGSAQRLMATARAPED